MSVADEMEKAARAICGVIGVEPDEMIYLPVARKEVVAWRVQLPKARAAYIATVKAIREASTAMGNAGDVAQTDAEGDPVAVSAPIVWRAMVDAKLAEIEAASPS